MQTAQFLWLLTIARVGVNVEEVTAGKSLNFWAGNKWEEASCSVKWQPEILRVICVVQTTWFLQKMQFWARAFSRILDKLKIKQKMYYVCDIKYDLTAMYIKDFLRFLWGKVWKNINIEKSHL